MDPFGSPNRYRYRDLYRNRKEIGLGHANGIFANLRSMGLGASENRKNRDYLIALFRQMVPTDNVDPDSDSVFDKPELHAIALHSARSFTRIPHLPKVSPEGRLRSAAGRMKKAGNTAFGDFPCLAKYKRYVNLLMRPTPSRRRHLAMCRSGGGWTANRSPLPWKVP